jgi:hypothetical protein
VKTVVEHILWRLCFASAFLALIKLQSAGVRAPEALQCQRREIFNATGRVA